MLYSVGQQQVSDDSQVKISHTLTQFITQKNSSRLRVTNLHKIVKKENLILTDVSLLYVDFSVVAIHYLLRSTRQS